jgi:enoyl-CoA hydratase/carnithine racemase
MEKNYENIVVEYPVNGVGLARMNQPRAFNALTGPMLDEVMSALEAMNADDAIGCMVLTGTERVFAAGADIKEMAGASVAEIVKKNFIARWERLRQIHKPVIAAVSGYALGGGCELAMGCDMIVASETAVFGQPEINLGVMPGAGVRSAWHVPSAKP